MTSVHPWGCGSLSALRILQGRAEAKRSAGEQDIMFLPS
jgi:hypothetical protein